MAVIVAALSKGKSAAVDNILPELVETGGQTIMDYLIKICIAGAVINFTQFEIDILGSYPYDIQYMCFFS
ncbi:MAG: hypothetical protein AB2693_32245 [Candidatus Thiodiazotropha sp.]